jgi:hypothetical protein
MSSESLFETMRIFYPFLAVYYMLFCLFIGFRKGLTTLITPLNIFLD